MRNLFIARCSYSRDQACEAQSQRRLQYYGTWPIFPKAPAKGFCQRTAANFFVLYFIYLTYTTHISTSFTSPISSTPSSLHSHHHHHHHYILYITYIFYTIFSTSTSSISPYIICNTIHIIYNIDNAIYITAYK